MAHTLNWFEIPVADMDRAMRFYATLTGQDLRREGYGGPGEAMAVFTGSGDHEVGGALLQSPHCQPAAQGALIYLNAGPSLNAWLARVAPAGGQIVVPRTALPEGMGFFAHIIDSEGNRLGLHALA